MTHHRGGTTLTVRGPETKPTPVHSSMVGAEWVGIVLKHGAMLTHLAASKLVDGELNLPGASSRSFWLEGAAWQYPDFENASWEKPRRRSSEGPAWSSVSLLFKTEPLP